MKEIHPDDSNLRPNDSFWDVDYHAGMLHETEDAMPSLQTAGFAFTVLRSHRQKLLDYFYDDESPQTDQDIKILLADCERIGLEFGNHLLEHFAETPDDDNRIRQTVDILAAIHDSHSKLLTAMTDGYQEPIWDPETTADTLKQAYDQMPEMAFVHTIQEYIHKKLERMVRASIS